MRRLADLQRSERRRLRVGRPQSGFASPAAEDGFTLVEMIVVVAILGIVLAGMTQLFVSATRSQTDQTVRAQAQQDARLALDKLRREIHCGSSVSLNPNGALSAQAITIALGSYCPTNSAGSASVSWCTSATAPYTLWRYPHSTDLSTASYAAACTGSGRAWANDIVNAGGVTGGNIFSNPVAPTQPAMGSPDLAYGTTAGSLGNAATDTTYGYVVDPVTSMGEQPGTEEIVTLLAGSTGKSIAIDWSFACAAYPATPAISSFKIYGRVSGLEKLLATASSAGCATTSYTDTGSTTPSGASPAGATRAKLTVDLPVRADSSNLRLIELQDDIVLRNTPR